MKKQKTKTILIIVILAVIVSGIILVSQFSKWSELAYEAAVKVSLKDAFTEEVPFYYPTVYEIRIIDTEK